jgi:hypothetical protein
MAKSMKSAHRGVMAKASAIGERNGEISAKEAMAKQ